MNAITDTVAVQALGDRVPPFTVEIGRAHV